MPSKKASPARRPASKTTRSRRRGPALQPVPNAVAARYAPGQEGEVHEALAPFGGVEVHPQQRMIVLQCSSRVTTTRVRATLDELQRRKLVEFVTPVLRDPDSRTRQVLTDEIVIRLKPGRTQRTLKALTAAHDLEVGRRNEFEPSQYVVRVRKPSGTQTLDVARTLDRSDDVEFASPNFLTEIKR